MYGYWDDCDTLCSGSIRCDNRMTTFAINKAGDVVWPQEGKSMCGGVTLLPTGHPYSIAQTAMRCITSLKSQQDSKPLIAR
jgi:hypothetical protein